MKVLLSYDQAFTMYFCGNLIDAEIVDVIEDNISTCTYLPAIVLATSALLGSLSR